MSVRALKWAWSVKVPPTQKLVLLALADHLNKDSGKCCPSLTRLQEFTGLSRPSVWQSINKLIAANLVIRIKKDKSRATFYHLGNNITHSSGNQENMIGNQVNALGNSVNKVGNALTPNHIENQNNRKEPGATPKHVLVHLANLKGATRK